MNRWKCRQVLDCGDEVFEGAALDREPARTGRAGPFGDAEAKAVSRFARHRTPRRCRERLRFKVPVRALWAWGLSMNWNVERALQPCRLGDFPVARIAGLDSLVNPQTRISALMGPSQGDWLP